MGSLPLLLVLLTGGADGPTPQPQQLVPTIGTPAAPSDAYKPITGKERLEWAVKNTIGPGSLFIGAIQAGFGTLTDRPPEYREGAEGFGKRFGLRLSSVGTSSVLEAGLGSIWGEDPRYHLSHDHTARGHFRQALKMTFFAERADGTVAPAYARYIAFTGSNVISDAWRPDSQRNVSSTTTRIAERFAGRLVGNLFREYWPEIKQHTFLNKH
jgi:hypothetical protein